MPTKVGLLITTKLAKSGDLSQYLGASIASTEALLLSMKSLVRPKVRVGYEILIVSLSMTFKADGKRQLLPLIFYSFHVILKESHTKIEKCLLLFTANTNILILLYRELKTDGKSFILAFWRLPQASCLTSIIIQIGPCARSDWSKTHVLYTEYEK